MTRRRLLALGGVGLLTLVGLRLAVPHLARRRPRGSLSAAALAFAERCLAGLERSQVWDAHVHLVGFGSGGSGCSVNPDLRRHSRPLRRLQFVLYREGIGIGEGDPGADALYVERLAALQRAANPEGRLVVLAFDRNVAEDGTERPELTPFYTPNAWALKAAAEHPELVAAASVHPYRVDAVERLDAAVAAGARAVKWLPNAMGIDPASPRCDRFYRRLAELGVPLISHGGKEYAVDARSDQALGNVLRLRRALDAGVRLVVAHCASLGSFADIDAAERERRVMRSFDLFLRLFGEPQYERTLFADISSLTQVHHGYGPLRELLGARELHPRLVYASDYPLCALRFMISPTRLWLAGHLSSGERRLCRELFEHNPLLFDFAVSRSVRVEAAGRTHRFADEVFETAALFSSRSAPA